MRNYQGTVHDSMNLNYDLASDMDSYILLRICGINGLRRASALTSSSKEKMYLIHWQEWQFVFGFSFNFKLCQGIRKQVKKM